VSFAVLDLGPYRAISASACTTWGVPQIQSGPLAPACLLLQAAERGVAEDFLGP
jgi:hypothetical protein